MSHPQKAIANAIEKPGAEPGMSSAIPFADTNIIPDRNAGIGSLLWDLQRPQDPDRDGPPLLNPEFAFIDVGVSRAKVATALKALLAGNLKMHVEYVATERLEAVPYAHVTPLGEQAARIRGCLSRVISTKGAMREVKDWHFVIDRTGRVSSVAYAYNLHGNEVWEAYFMGRPFMVSGQKVEFLDPVLDEMLADDVSKIEARIDLERRRDADPSQPPPSWDGYRMERNPLEAGLSQFGIALQQTGVPRRLKGRQNVLFLGNVLNHYPQNERALGLERIAAHMEEGDIVIIQGDDAEASFIEVLYVKGHGALKMRQRVRAINTRTLEVQKLDRSSGSWLQIRMKPEVARLANRLLQYLGMRVSPLESRQDGRAARYVNHVFATYLRAWPVEDTLRIAIREALRRLPTEEGTKVIPAAKGDSGAGDGGALGLEASPIVSEAVLFVLDRNNPEPGGDNYASKLDWAMSAGAASEKHAEKPYRKAEQ